MLKLKYQQQLELWFYCLRQSLTSTSSKGVIPPSCSLYLSWWQIAKVWFHRIANFFSSSLLTNVWQRCTSTVLHYISSEQIAKVWFHRFAISLLTSLCKGVLPPYLQKSAIENWIMMDWSIVKVGWYPLPFNEANMRLFTMGRRCNVISTLFKIIKFAKSDFRQKHKKISMYITFNSYVQLLYTWNKVDVELTIFLYC